MDIYKFSSLFIIFYFMIFILDHFLKLYSHTSYLNLTEKIGLSVRICYFNIFTRLFNRPVVKLALRYKKIFNIYFRLGSVCVLLLLIPSIIFLMYNLIQTCLQYSKSAENDALLKPIVPGINLPMNEVPYYFIALFFATVFHELGHALAAVCEDVRINGVGFMMMFVLPGAYVDISRDCLEKLPYSRQLKILCAGIWQNIVLVTSCFGFYVVLPHLLAPFYNINKGLLVWYIDENSPASGPSGLKARDVIEGVNHCTVSNHEQWLNCLLKEYGSVQSGFCVSKNFISENDATMMHAYRHSDNTFKCCEKSLKYSHLCFVSPEEDDGPLSAQPMTCLPGRGLINETNSTCTTSSDCSNEDLVCIIPSIPEDIRLLSISRRSVDGGTKLRVLYLGTTSEIYYTVKCSDFVPKFSLVPGGLPQNMILTLDYMIKFSGGLGLINLIPCFFLDGFWISKAFLEALLGDRLVSDAVKALHYIITLFGSLLLIVSCLVALITQL